MESPANDVDACCNSRTFRQAHYQRPTQKLSWSLSSDFYFHDIRVAPSYSEEISLLVKVRQWISSTEIAPNFELKAMPTLKIHQKIFFIVFHFGGSRVRHHLL